MAAARAESRAGRWRAATAAIGLLLAGVALPLLVVELILRGAGLAAPVELDASFDRPVRYYRPEAERLHPWAADAPDPLRVAVIGDSFTDGQSNHRYDAYPARLEALLNLNGGQRPAAVRVWAERGSSTFGQIKYLRRALEWGPDIVVLGIFLNDAEWVGDRQLERMRGELRPRIPTGRLAWLLRRSAALAWIYQRLENLRCSRAAAAYYRYLFDPDYEGFERFERAIRAFSNQTRAAGVHFLPVVFPGLAARGDDYRMGFAHQRIGAVLEAHEVTGLDLLEVYRETLPVRMSAFPRIDAHPSEIAHRLAADAIFHRLLADGALDDGYRPRQVETKGRGRWLRELRRMKDVVSLAEP